MYVHVNNLLLQGFVKACKDEETGAGCESAGQAEQGGQVQQETVKTG